MKDMKRWIALLLCVVMVLSLTACGDKTENNGNSQAEGFVYVPSYTKVEGDFPNGLGGQMVYSGDAFYSMMYEYDNPETYDGGHQVLYRIGLDGKSEKLAGYVPDAESEDEYSYSNVQGMTLSKDGKLVLLHSFTQQFFNLPEGFVDDGNGNRWDYYDRSESTFSLKWLKEDGSLDREMDLTDLGGEDSYIDGFCMDNDGNLYIKMDSKVVVLDANGGKLFEYESEDGGWINTVVPLKDGSVAAAVSGEKGYNLIRLDPVAKKSEQYCTTDSYFWNTCPGSGDYELFYSNGSYLYGLKVADGVGTEEKVLTWLNSDVDGDEMRNFVVNEEGNILGLTEEYIENPNKKDTTEDMQTTVEVDGSVSVSSTMDRHGSYDVKILTLTKTPAKDVQQKETLTLATQYLAWDTRKAILKFNRANPDYRIEILDYSEYNTEDDYEAGVKKLTTEIMAGDMPDMIYTEGLPVAQMGAKGKLTDLYTFMENDKDVSKDKFLPSVLKLMETDGHLYQTASSFSIQTVIGNKNVVGDTPGWTVADLKAALAAMPAGCSVFGVGVTRDDILRYMLYMDMNDYVDWVNGTCNFDSQQFMDLLEFTKLFPSEFDWSSYEWTAEDNEQARIASGKQLLSATSFGDFNDMQYNTAAFGDDAVFIGFPTTDGVGNAMYFSSGYAISSTCAHPDVAWQFIKGFMTGEYSNSWGFSPLKEKFDAAMKEAMTPRYKTDENGDFVLDENGNKIEESQGGWSDGVNDYEFYAMTQEEADKLMELINSCTKVMNQDDSLMEIIKEESAAFYNDQKSAEETAKMVQSRVNVYIKEQA